MELYDRVHQVQSLFGERNLFQYLFLGQRVVLVDSGIAETPEKAILPYLDKVKIRPDQLTLVITTHPDLDHQGGNSTIKKISPRTLISCGEADRVMVEDPRRLFELRYNYLRADHGLGFDPEPIPEAGKPCKVDLGFRGGEKIRLDDDWELEVLHVPGHSHGHLALYDAKHKAAFVSDAIHGRGCPKADGSMALPVTYFFVDVYLSTLRFFESLDIDNLYSGHWPNMHGEEVRDFIAESRQTVELFDRVILSSLAKNPAGLTLKQFVDAIANAVGDWPGDNAFQAMFPLKGHLERLESLGKVRFVRDPRPPVWVRS